MRSVHRYLADNYSFVDAENAFLLGFLHDFYDGVAPCGTLVEVGGGGALYSLLSARRRVRHATYLEPNPEARREILRWLDGDPSAHSWNAFLEHVHALEQAPVSISAMAADLRRCLRRVSSFDVFAPWQGAQFDIVSSHFCVESMATTRAEFDTGVDTLCRMLAPGGHLVLSLLLEGHYWTFGSNTVRCFAMGESDILTALARNGLQVSRACTSSPGNGEKHCAEAADGQNYRGLLCVTAQRQPPSS